MTAADLPARFRPIIEQVVERIAVGDFDGLARDYSRPDHDLGAWAREYPATFIPLPTEAWHRADAYFLADHDAWKVDVDLLHRVRCRDSAVLDFEERYGYRLATTPSAGPTQPLLHGSLLPVPPRLPGMTPTKFIGYLLPAVE